MATILLSQGQVALVDDDRYAELAAVKWYAHRMVDKAGAVTYYAVRSSGSIRMHREVMGLKPGDPREIDHVNGLKLDNQRTNLRLATRSQNEANSPKAAVWLGRATHSVYKGVTFDSWRAKRGYPAWRAQIGPRVYLGYFTTETDAAAAYDAAASERYGAFARLNFPRGR